MIQKKVRKKQTLTLIIKSKITSRQKQSKLINYLNKYINYISNIYYNFKFKKLGN